MATGRVIEVQRTNMTVALAGREVVATVRGGFHATGEFPVVGDHVELELLADDKAVVERILERQSVIRRRGAEDDEVQIIVANVDLIFIVMGLDGDYNLSRLERYLLLAAQSQIPAVVVLNKCDVVDEVAPFVSAVETVAGGTPVHAVSALTGDGLPAVARHITPTTTAVLLGSSGAGKSTITNWLLQEERQAVREVRADDAHGRHTTTSRQLFTLPGGGYLIDTPGMRELGILESDTESEQTVFERVSAFADRCQFNDCDHEKSAGCAVLAAVESGELTERELNNYRKLQKERAWEASKDSPAATRHYEQNRKRLYQKYEKMRRQRLGRG